MVFPTFKSAAFAILATVGAVVSAQEEGEPNLKVMFVNQFPDTPIDLYWENHSFPDDHPDRRRLEATIAPRGGWHASETFVGHGKFNQLQCTLYLLSRVHRHRCIGVVQTS